MSGKKNRGICSTDIWHFCVYKIVLFILDLLIDKYIFLKYKPKFVWIFDVLIYLFNMYIQYLSIPKHVLVKHFF